MLICPVCGEKLMFSDKTMRCGNGHSFDIAKEGYVNLLRSSKNGDLIGDDKISARMRRDFLNKGYYAPLMEELCRIFADKKGNVLDICCGEGYYTAALGNNENLCVFGFDIQCEAEDIKKIIYKIQDERTASNISEFYKNSVWFLEVSDKECQQDNMDFPFDYRCIETEDAEEVYTYLGSELGVEEKKQNERNYYLEYRIGKDEHGNLYAESFDIQVIIEKKDGTIIEKKLEFEPVFEMGEVCVNELWVKVE